MYFANSSWEMGSVFTITSGWRIWFSIHSAVRRCVTPARSGPVTFFPNAWQAEQPLVWNSFSPTSALASSTGDSAARGPESYLETASTLEEAPELGGGVAAAPGAADSPSDFCPPQPAASSVVRSRAAGRDTRLFIVFLVS